MFASRRRFLKEVSFGAAALSLSHRSYSANIANTSFQSPNILMIAVDDLRPQLNCYGHAHMISPNIDRLADEGVRFNRTYCQVPVCGASRASLLTGLRPSHDRFLNYDTRADADATNIIPLSLQFKKHGYYTISNGKIFHNNNDFKESWSEAPWRPQGKWRDYQLSQNIDIAQKNDGTGPAYENAEVNDSDYKDGKLADKTISDLQRLKQMNQPFFLATGFFKPHLPFTAPKKYWNMY